MIYCDWSSLKNLYSIKKISPQYVEDDLNYQVHLFDGIAHFYCQILKGTDDASEFVSSYKSLCNARLVDPSPFAKPEYRTKLNATASVLTISPNSDADIQFKLLEERYVTGGTLTVQNAQIGDYFVAEVEDVDGVIPAPYRSALCESWPVVATYAERQWIEVQGEFTTMRINTYPLNAKITAGLYLCIHYYAVDAGSDRKLVVNYHLTKKL